MLIESFYLPNIEYFSIIIQHQEIYIEAHENYQKQSYRNRCKVLTANKLVDLIVPVLNGNSKEIVKNIRLDNSQNWKRTHIRTLKSAYGKAPFFEYYFDYFQNVFEKKHDFLIDFNTELLTTCLHLMRVKKEILFTEKFEKSVNDDFRSKFHPKKEELTSVFLHEIKYTQNFGEEFVPNLSIIDLLMCQGPEAHQFLLKYKNG